MPKWSHKAPNPRRASRRETPVVPLGLLADDVAAPLLTCCTAAPRVRRPAVRSPNGLRARPGNDRVDRSRPACCDRPRGAGDACSTGRRPRPRRHGRALNHVCSSRRMRGRATGQCRRWAPIRPTGGDRGPAPEHGSRSPERRGRSPERAPHYARLSRGWRGAPACARGPGGRRLSGLARRSRGGAKGVDRLPWLSALYLRARSSAPCSRGDAARRGARYRERVPKSAGVPLGWLRYCFRGR